MSNSYSKKEIEECIINVGLRIAKRKKGALFIVGKIKCKPMSEQNISQFNALENKDLLEKVALIGGATILDERGNVVAYDSFIETKLKYTNFGTRHSAAVTASKRDGNFVLLVSKKDKKIRIFKNGKIIIQINPKEKNIENSTSGILKIMESISSGKLGVIGASLVTPGIGISIIPGLIVFGSAYILEKRYFH